MNDPVRVYWNSRSKKFSVQTRIKVLETPKWHFHGYKDLDELELDLKEKYIWRVTNRITGGKLVNVTFKVSEAGRQKVLRTRTKNVHAYIEGYPTELEPGDIERLNREIHYNPYKHEKFTDELGYHILKAPEVVIYCYNNSPIIKI